VLITCDDEHDDVANVAMMQTQDDKHWLPYVAVYLVVYF
jgi:hypothetical protein